ncbi:S1 family peptidase [Natronosalvus halobius]|uniref:S1 family peptidase n=1 Tax=Natronosalvus halobius TaxID=2953746 RepID=UPI00209E3B21|nr:serine protease [Natronosalvus halobius]USZ71999.1 serine protease [Natronosalvus halobius]
MSANSPDWLQNSTHPLYTTVTRIRFPHEEGHATGFFYNSGEQTYLVTNRHVLNWGEKDSPDSMRIFTRELKNLGERQFHDIDLSKGDGSNWYSHPHGSAIDVVVIPLDFKLDSINPRIGISNERPSETGSLAFNNESILSQKERVLAGDRSQVIGYPGQYIDQNSDFPVTRNAIISTQYGMPYNGNPIFLTDARMHPGTSGSPVLAGPVTLINYNGIDLWGPAYKLLGVHSATLRQIDVNNENHWLDLNTAWYAELIEETIQHHDE